MTRENLVKFLKLVKPYLVVILLQFGYAGMGIIAKSALNDGMSPFTYAVYRSFFAAAFLAPFAVAFERNIRPKMTVPIFLKIMTLALLEPVIDMNLHFIGMKYTTATFATSLSNVLPAITFILAWILRVFGAGVIVIGLYMVLWGKKQDQDSQESLNDQVASIDKPPSTLVKFPTKQEPIDTPRAIAGDEAV
nr:WAT1-related protein At2g39510-like [Ipomoea batatas]